MRVCRQSLHCQSAARVITNIIEKENRDYSPRLYGFGSISNSLSAGLGGGGAGVLTAGGLTAGSGGGAGASSVCFRCGFALTREDDRVDRVGDSTACVLGAGDSLACAGDSSCARDSPSGEGV